MNRSETITKLATALVKFNSEVSSISEDAKNPFFKSSYVTLDALIIATRNILQKNGLVVMQSPLSKEDGSIGIQSLLIHESGEFIESEPIFMKPAKANDPQQAGSIITYMRRYSYQAILNLNTGEDDDANFSTHGANKSDPKPKQSNSNSNIQVNMQPITQTDLISEAQRKRLYAISNGKDQTTVKSIINKYGFDSSKDVTKDKYKNICDEIDKL